MADVSEVLVEERITWQGKDWIVLPPGLKCRGLFSSVLARNAIKFVRQNKEAYDKDFLTALDRVSRKGGAFGFSWGSEAWEDAIRTAAGSQELALLMLQQSHPEFTIKMVLDLWETPGGKTVDEETGEEIDVTLGKELADKMTKLINRPNLLRPSETTDEP